MGAQENEPEWSVKDTVPQSRPGLRVTSCPLQPQRGATWTSRTDLNSTAGDAFPSLNTYVSKQALGSLQKLTAQPQSPPCRNTPKRHC